MHGDTEEERINEEKQYVRNELMCLVPETKAANSFFNALGRLMSADPTMHSTLAVDSAAVMVKLVHTGTGMACLMEGGGSRVREDPLAVWALQRRTLPLQVFLAHHHVTHYVLLFGVCCTQTHTTARPLSSARCNSAGFSEC